MPSQADLVGQATDVITVALCSAVQAGGEIEEVLPTAVREATSALAPRGFQGDADEIDAALRRAGAALLEAAR